MFIFKGEDGKKKVRVIAVNIVGILWDIIMCVHDPNAVILATI